MNFRGPKKITNPDKLLSKLTALTTDEQTQILDYLYDNQKFPNIYQNNGVRYLLRHVEEFNAAYPDYSWYNEMPITPEMSKRLIEGIERPEQIKALNIALGHRTAEKFAEQFEKELNNDPHDTLLWFQCLAIVAQTEDKYQISLNPFEQRFVIPQQIRIAKKTVARMRAQEHEHD